MDMPVSFERERVDIVQGGARGRAHSLYWFDNSPRALPAQGIGMNLESNNGTLLVLLSPDTSARYAFALGFLQCHFDICLKIIYLFWIHEILVPFSPFLLVKKKRDVPHLWSLSPCQIELCRDGGLL